MRKQRSIGFLGEVRPTRLACLGGTACPTSAADPGGRRADRRCCYENSCVGPAVIWAARASIGPTSAPHRQHLIHFGQTWSTSSTLWPTHRALFANVGQARPDIHRHIPNLCTTSGKHWQAPHTTLGHLRTSRPKVGKHSSKRWPRCDPRPSGGRLGQFVTVAVRHEVRVSFVVGGGKSMRQKHSDSLGRALGNALQEPGQHCGVSPCLL